MERGWWRGREKRGWSSGKQRRRPSRARRCSPGRRAAVRYEQDETQASQNGGPSTSESPSSSSSSCQSSPVPELPGFYYDPEKNRYFRLLPGHNNYNPLTKESIQYREMECKRLKLLEEDEQQKKKASRAGLNSSILLHKRQLGLLSSTNYCRLVHELKVNCMQKRKIEIHGPDSSVAGTNNFKIIVADAACERIFAVNDVEHGGCKYGIINLSGLGKESLTVEMYDNLYFTNRKTPVLYNGCRSGEIFSIDVRQRSQKGQSWKAVRLFHDSAVTSVRLLQTEYYLMAADMAGKIKLWDLRVAKCVKQYKGHHNEYATLPLHINEEEGLLTAVGQDCYTRIWSLQDTHLLRTIPSPHPSSKDSIPSVVFSSKLGGNQGVPGLLMAVRQDLYHFSYS
uniref:DDB1 and CUL4 associated factor 4 n=1 Tax=Crocodylus porosus TaxID=8502 RepID=A0A7M4FK53_CROPO